MITHGRRLPAPLAALLLLAFLPAAGIAQTQGSPPHGLDTSPVSPDTAGGTVRLEEGVRVRLRLASSYGTRRAGRVLSTSGDRLTLLVDGESAARTVSLSEVRELEVSRGVRSHAGTGFAIGAAAGGTLGLLAGLALSGSDGFLQADAGDVAKGTMVLGMLGGLVGTAIGASSKSDRWESVDPASVRLGLAPGPDGGLALGLRVRFGRAGP